MRAWWLAFAVLAACTDSDRDSGTCPALDAVLVGYRALSEAPGGALTAWFTPADPLALELPAGAALESRFVHAGGTHTPEVTREPQGPHEIVRLHLPALGPGRLEVTWNQCALQLAAHGRPDPKDDPRLQPAEQLRERDPAGADRLLVAAEQAAGSDPWIRMVRAALAFRQGDQARGLVLLTEGAALAQEAGHYTLAAEQLRLAVHRALIQRQYGQAEVWLAQATQLLAGRLDPRGHARLQHYRGRLEEARQRNLEALRHYRAAAATCLDLGDGCAQGALEAEAAVLSRLGRHADALAHHRGLAMGAPYPQWTVQVNREWIRLESMRSCQTLRSYDAVYQAMLALAQTPPSPATPAERANAWINAAYAAHLAGQPARAEAALAQAKTADPGGGLEPTFTRQLRAELLLATDRPAAAAIYQALADEAAQSGQPSDDRWRALYGLGRAQPDRALAHWLEAAAVLQQVSDRVELQAGRASFHADRRELLDALLGHLLGQARWLEALEIMERFRSPVLRALQREATLHTLAPAELERWTRGLEDYERLRKRLPELRRQCEEAPGDQKVACQRQIQVDERAAAQQLDQAWQRTAAPASSFALPALAPDEALLVWLPVRPPGSCETVWHRLLLRAGQVQPVPGDLAALLPHLAAVQHLYLLAHGAPEADELLALEVEGLPLAARVGISFVARLRLPPATPSPLGALVVADPDGTEPHGRATGERLGRHLPGQLLVGPQATREAILDRWRGGLRWFHFDGHGHLAPQDPWNAHLRLVDPQTTLNATDILAHEPRIGTVVLSACHAAETSRFSDLEALSLAEAFVLAGADQVLAAEGEVSPEAAARVMKALYAEGKVPTDLGEAWRRAVAELHRQGNPEWRRWRRFGRRQVEVR